MYRKVSSTWKAIGLVVVLLMVFGTLIGCGAAATATPAPAATEAPAPAATEAPAAATEAPAAATEAPAATQASAGGKQLKKIGYSVWTLDFTFFQAMNKGTKDEAAKLGAEFTVVDARSDPKKQIADVESLIAQKPDAIIITPVDPPSIGPAVQAAKDAGIPVVIDDIGATGPFNVQVVSDNADGGKQAADYIDKMLKARPNASKNVALIPVQPQWKYAFRRGEGFKARMQELGYNVAAEVVPQPTAEGGYNAMQSILSAHPDISAVFVASGREAVGAGKAIAAAGKDPIKDILVVGFNADPEEIEAMRAGQEGATIMQVPAEMGKMSVDIAAKLVSGEMKAEGEEVLVPVVMITPENIDQYFPQEGGAATTQAAAGNLPGDKVQYTWDNNAKKWSPSAPDPTGTNPSSWTPNVRKATKKWLIGFSNISRNIDFGVQVENGIKKNADAAGVDLFANDDKYPDGQMPLTNADAMVTRKVDFFLNFNVLANVGPAIMEKMNAAGIPSASIDVVHKGAVFFGADNYASGVVAGEWMIDYAKKNNIPEDQMTILRTDSPEVGEVPNLRGKGFVDTMSKAFPKAKVAHIPGGGATEPAMNSMAGWLTANPNDHYILANTLNDQEAAGILAATQAAGREKDLSILGTGCDAPAKAELVKPENAFKGSVGYFPEKYGDYLIPLALDILEGKPVPAEVHLKHVVVDRSNFKEFYPDYKTQ